MKRVVLACGLIWALSSAIAVAPSSAQATAEASDPSPAQATAEAEAVLSADTVGQGDVFELSIGVHVPPGSAVYFPDTVPTVFALESFRPVAWAAELDGEGAALSLTYPLIAFEAGSAPVPGLDVYFGPAASASGERLPGQSVVGSWGDIEDGTVDRASLTRAAVGRRLVWVVSAIVPENVADGLEPRPPADVAGSDWDWPSVIVVLALSALIVAVVRSVVVDLLPDRAAEEPLDAVPGDAARVRRQRALDELDRILALGLHTEGRTVEFYGRSSGVVRTFVEAFETEWRPSLTSSELMGRLEARTNGSAPDLYASMHAAEVVKFGRLRPDADTAEGHWRALRSWVLVSPSVEP